MNNNDVTLNARDLNLRKKLYSAILFAIYPAYILNACVVAPLYTVTDSNVAYIDLIPLIFYFLGIVIDLFAIFFSLAVVFYGLHRLSFKNLRSVIILVAAAPFFKNVLKLIVSPFVDGVLNMNLLIMDSYTLGMSSVLEVLQLAIIVFLAYKPIKAHREKKVAVDKALGVLGKDKVPEMELIPFKKIFNLKNPLQRGAFIASAVVTLARIVMHLINDLWMISSVSLSMMFFLPYVLAIVGGAAGYLLIIYVLISISLKDTVDEE